MLGIIAGVKFPKQPIVNKLGIQHQYSKNEIAQYKEHSYTTKQCVKKCNQVHRANLSACSHSTLLGHYLVIFFFIRKFQTLNAGHYSIP